MRLSSCPEVNSERASAAYYKEALAITLQRLAWRNVTSGKPTAQSTVVWFDDPIRRPHFLALPVSARINRFYAMVRVCRKVCLAQLLDACARLHPEEFSAITPVTWWVGKSWPSQLAEHRAFCGRSGRDDAPFIVKPDNGCQGAGISLVRGHVELASKLRAPDAPERAVVQSYLSRPLLLDGLKFDLRLYVVLTCAAPLQAFLSVHGVARFATHAWQPLDASNQDNLLMHLSNSSINQVASGVSNKVTLAQLWERLARDGHDAAAVQARVRRVVALTLAAMQPIVAHNYANAFTTGVPSNAPSRRASRENLGPAAAAPTADVASGGLRSRRSTKEALAAAAPAPSAVEPLGMVGMTIKSCGTPPAAAPAPAKPSVELQGSDAASAPVPASGAGGGGREATGGGGGGGKGARRSFQILGFDVMLDDDLNAWLLEVNHSPSMALGGAEPGEVEAKTSVLRAALRLGLADDHPQALCDECEVVALQEEAAPYCSLDAARRLFESHATSRSQQQWALGFAAFERIFAPLGVGTAKLRSVFAAACSARADSGTGWDEPSKGMMTLFGFVEAVLQLAEAHTQQEVQDEGGGATAGLAAAVEALLHRVTVTGSSAARAA